MKKLFILFLLIVLCNICFAQLKIGIHGGIINSQVAIKDTNKLVMAAHGDKKSRIGFQAGVFSEIPISRQVSFSPAINFVYKGGDFKTKFFENNINIKYITGYIEVPLNLTIKSNGGGLYGGAGPTVGMGIGGKRKYTNAVDGGSTTTETRKIKFDGKTWMEAGLTDYHLKKFELGLNAFIGYELPSGLRIQVQYRPDFSNLSTTSSISSYKNSYFSLTVGCLL